jgi:hypothetical protein
MAQLSGPLYFYPDSKVLSTLFRSARLSEGAVAVWLICFKEPASRLCSYLCTPGQICEAGKMAQLSGHLFL